MSRQKTNTGSPTAGMLNGLFPEILLLLYGIGFVLYGEKALYRLDVSYAAYESYRLLFGGVVPCFLLLSGIGWKFFCARKNRMSCKAVLLSCSILLALAGVVIGTGMQKRLVSREKFRSHDCREALKLFFSRGMIPHCPGAISADSYWVFEKIPSPVPLPLAMDLPGNHRGECNILYSDGSIVRLVTEKTGSCRELLMELNRRHPIPPEQFGKLCRTAEKHDMRMHALEEGRP